MHVRDLPLPRELAAHFESSGIEELYPPQAAAVDAGVCRGENVLVAVPTAAGKTFVAELAMLTAEGPALYIVPLRALAREKYETFSELPGVGVGISTGDYGSAAEELAGHDIVVATSEKVDSALRNGAGWVEDLACVVVDEIHLLGSEDRGPTLEVTATNLRRRSPGVQVVGLSATVDNPEEVADWLDAALVESRWRPVDLRTGVYDDGRVDFDDGTGLELPPGGGVNDDPPAGGAAPNGGTRAADDRSTADAPAPRDDDGTAATVALVEDAVEGGGQCLAFVSSRGEAEALADRLAGRDLGTAGDVAEAVADVDATPTGRRLAACVREGVAFHHAGLRSAHREVVETAFRERDLPVICATPTLAAGVNVPARRVVVRDLERYTGSEMAPLPVLEVHQMCGRAGRPGLDPYGEAVLVAADADPETVRERYVYADPEAVGSKLVERSALRTHVLAAVATGFAGDLAELRRIFGGTFFAHQRPGADLGDIVGSAVDELRDLGMLAAGGEDSDEGEAARGTDGDEDHEGTDADGDALAATPLGEQVCRQYVTPETGRRIVDGLRTAAGMDGRTELTVLQVVCATPDMQDTYLGNRERAEMYRFAAEHAGEFTTEMGEAEDFEGWLESVKTARVLAEWAAGTPVEEVVERFRVGPGDLESRVERAEWLLGAADALADVAGLDVPEIEAVKSRL